MKNLNLIVHIICFQISVIFCQYDQFQGYTYSNPEKILQENNSLSTEHGVQYFDFIDDIVTDQKQQILSTVLETVEEDTSPNVGEHKYFYYSRCAACSCGLPNSNRIVGGSYVQSNKYPWIAQILYGDSQFCGGSLINDRYVLTAAHCIYGVDASLLSVRLLKLNTFSYEAGILRYIVYGLMHPYYDPSGVDHDIALLRLDHAVPMYYPIRPVCLPSSTNQNFDYKIAIVAGWGAITADGLGTHYLREALVPVLSNAQCRATNYRDMITHTMLCAGYVQGGPDSCQGDSGGPLIVPDRVYRLAGVVSYGIGCGYYNYPGVYTRVSKYLSWIYRHTRDACYCAK